MVRFDEFFDVQIGGGGFGRVYIGAPQQRGHGGIGSFLAGALRRVLPLLTRGAKAVGKEALRTGMNIMSDVAARNTPIRESFSRRVREFGENLKRKAEEKIDKLMEGSGGYKDEHSLSVLQSLNYPTVNDQKKNRRKRRKKSTRRLNPSKRRKTQQTSKKRKKKEKRIRTVKRKNGKKRTLKDIFD